MEAHDGNKSPTFDSEGPTTQASSSSSVSSATSKNSSIDSPPRRVKSIAEIYKRCHFSHIVDPCRFENAVKYPHGFVKSVTQCPNPLCRQGSVYPSFRVPNPSRLIGQSKIA